MTRSIILDQPFMRFIHAEENAELVMGRCYPLHLQFQKGAGNHQSDSLRPFCNLIRDLQKLIDDSRRLHRALSAVDQVEKLRATPNLHYGPLELGRK
ncbi:hypothetical protein [Sphingobium sp. SCG-1]|uniref:hypothetical protein n=1 Tax=Sphingobium sp. SCG-1 TaxID=2072936 RepID=UPI0011AB896D|nr:hypothetical protein [Sphingobium sp. SCG-1]